MNRIEQIKSNALVSEKAIEAYLVKRVKELGGKCLKYANPSETGYPDRLVILPYRLAFWVELKSYAKKPRPIQTKRINELRKLGQTVHVVSSREAVDYILSEAEQTMKLRKWKEEHIQ